LKKENTRLQAENDILKKAAIILGSKPQGSFAR
jgi:transposase-like protein